ncbi:alpha/beta fold hydrolase [Gorillibacterium timonense]|uniref:alpha/beta fold hydrolase n=1 Tax=Gorillibacterium timonense TaxID=1689269 RepID=UPI00071D0CFF|nr:alpha/beta hydrolase [Gorillibacterium timonense]
MNIYRSAKAEQRIMKSYDELLQQWGTDFEEKEIATTYGTTHVIVCGKEEGKPVVLFHGVGDDSALMWIYNMKALAGEFRLYAVDTIGGPGKSRPNDHYGKEFDDVTWIDEVLSGLSLVKPDLMGVSNGGYLAQLYKAERPDQAGKAIVISSTVPVEKVGSVLKTMMKIFMPEALFPTRKNIIRLLRKLTGDRYSVFTEHETIMKHYTELLRGFNNMAMKFHKVGYFTPEQIERIKPDAYYIVGEEDPFQKLGGKDALLQMNMNVRFYPGVGHGLNHEIADEANALISQILNDRVKDIRNSESAE